MGKGKREFSKVNRVKARSRTEKLERDSERRIRARERKRHSLRKKAPFFKFHFCGKSKGFWALED
jgi:hypothetical protein